MHQCFCSEERTDQTSHPLLGGSLSFYLWNIFVWDLKAHPVLPPALTGTPPTTPGCSKLCPTHRTQRSNKDLNNEKPKSRRGVTEHVLLLLGQCPQSRLVLVTTTQAPGMLWCTRGRISLAKTLGFGRQARCSSPCSEPDGFAAYTPPGAPGVCLLREGVISSTRPDLCWKPHHNGAM